MRSGVIAQKVGMTRVFTDAGEHIPVTVLKLEKVQVLAQRTDEKNGYTSLQLGAGSRKPSRVTRAERDEVTRRIMGEIAALLAAERERPLTAAPGRAGAS